MLSINGKSIQSPSTKLVHVTQMNSTIFITYTGIGRRGLTDTSATLKAWLEGVSPNASFETVTEIIRRKASIWHSNIREKWPHSFVAVSFDSGVPTTAVISNFQTVDGRQFPLSSEFKNTRSRLATRSAVILTGTYFDRKDRPFTRVVETLRRALVGFVSAEQHPHVVRRKIRSLNLAVARMRPELVSRDCWVSSETSRGQHMIESFGSTPFQPPTLVSGIDMMKRVTPFLETALGRGGWTMVGASGVRAQDVAQPEPPVCTIDPILGVDFLELPSGRSGSPRFSNGAGIVVGHGQPALGSPHYPCVWAADGKAIFLSHAGGFGGSAEWISEDGVVIGSTELPNRRLVACSWSSSGARSDFGETAGRHSSALAGNKAGDLVGWASTHPTEGGQIHFRPAIWRKGTKAQVLHDIPGEWGEAVAANNHGSVLARLHKGALSAAFLIQGQNIAWLGEPHENTKAMYPRAIYDDNSIITLVILTDGARLCCCRDQTGRWSSIMEPASGREFISVSDDMTIVGYDNINDYKIPWIKEDGGDLQYLSHPKHHNVKPASISASFVVGAASGDYCSHPLRWAR